MTERTRAVVLGGTGFVGRHICEALAAHGHDVTAVSRAEGAVLPGVRHACADLVGRPDRLRGMLEALRPRLVVNAMGAVWDTGPEQMDQANHLAVHRLVDLLSALGRRPRLVHLGSVHEYGPVPAGRPLDERIPPRPETPYGRTKLLGTGAVLDARRAGRLDAVVLRLSNGVGPGAPRSSLLGRVAEQLHAAPDDGSPVVLRLAPLTARRDFIDVRDIADAVAAAARPVRIPHPVLNIGRGRSVPVRQLVRMLISVSGVQARIAETEAAPDTRGGGLEWQRVDITAAAHSLAWRPRRLLEDALHALWQESRCSQAR